VTTPRLALEEPLQRLEVIGGLQRAAGNRAVAAWLQRQPVPGPDAGSVSPPPPTLDERFATATAALTDPSTDAAIWSDFTQQGGTSAQIAERIWASTLALGDVPFPQPPKGAVGRGRPDAARTLGNSLTTRVNKVVTDKVKELIAKAGKKEEQDGIKTELTAIATSGLGWDARDLANELWRRWVGPARISDGMAGGAWPKQLFTALSGVAAKGAPGMRKDAFGSAAPTLDAAEISAVETVLTPMPGWVRTVAEYEAVTDQVHRARGGNADHKDPSWQELNGRMPRLVVHAEAKIVNGLNLAKTKVPPEIWAEFRGRYMATISKTIWRYHADNIVGTKVFGTQVDEKQVGQGLHREVAQALRLVEESALRLSGFTTIDQLKGAQGSKGTDKTVMKNPITLPGTEFRFEPMSHGDWMRRNGVMSPHGTGRAIDFRAATNPSIGEDTYEVLRLLAPDALAKEKLDEGVFDWVKGRQIAKAGAPLLQQRVTLEARIKDEQDPTVLSTLQADLAKVNEALANQPVTSKDAGDMRDIGKKALDRLARVEKAFQAAWQPFASKTDDKELLAALLAHADKARADAQSLLDKRLAQEAKDRAARDAMLKMIAAGVEWAIGAGVTGGSTPAPKGGATTGSKTPSKTTPPTKAPKPPPPPEKSAEVKALELAIARIDKLRPFLTLNKTTGKATGAQHEMLDKFRTAGTYGFTDMPTWLVQAFLERGWTWGGSWGGFLDAMHFDYLGPLTDVL